MVFANVLSGFNELDTSYLIENINPAQNNADFVSFYLPDSLTDDMSIEITPPNIEISTNNIIIPMQEWKELLQEWLLFLQQ